ncbi:hypothetical protein EOE18_15640 [Novosphingobium umbonatum]|uniref:Uncharacterized protein n=1 Tax=Novosphingobium umbonatum TaxID=1908524 RepID=A0A437N0T2_9SPHN|nr:hypothetical protein [Novosphingobium umbonatum]RVU03548.1 hypothetical protein EOE18_15640 [Novosphingobium umbonatum]
MAIVIRREDGKTGFGGKLRAMRRGRLVLLFLCLFLMLGGGIVALAWVKGAPQAMRVVSQEISVSPKKAVKQVSP